MIKKKNILNNANSTIPRFYWITLGFSWIIFGLLSLALADVIDVTWASHTIWCLFGLGLNSILLKIAYHKGFIILLTDHFVALISAFTLYFLIGALFIVFGDQRAIGSALDYYPVTPNEAMQVNAFNGIGLGIMLIAGALSPRKWFILATSRASEKLAHLNPRFVLVAISAIGASSFAYTLLYDFGFKQGNISGVLRASANLTIVSVYLFASYIGRYTSFFRILSIVLALLLSLFGLMMFNKTQILLSLLALLAGFLMRYRSRILLAGGILSIIFVYSLSTPVIAYGRNVLGYSPASMPVRLQIAAQGWATSEDDPLAKSDAWGRLSYVNVQAAAVKYYEQGAGGDDFSKLPWVFVPRFVVPDKPVISSTGEEFHQRITGFRGSSTGQGVFISGYYSAGWIGLFLASSLCGLVLAQTSAIAGVVIKRRTLTLLPFALLGVYIAFRVDGSFIVDYVGLFVYVLFIYLIFTLLWGLHSKNRLFK